MLWQGATQALAPVLGAGAVLLALHRRKGEATEQMWYAPIGVDGLRFFLLLPFLLWVVPGGLLLVLPGMLALSVASPAARAAWSEHRKERALVIGVSLLCFGASALLPVASPTSPEAWGQPFFDENPHAPVYPASHQYTWVTSDVVVLQSLSLRLPHQQGVWGAEWSALTLASAFNLETSRMHQAIELIDDALPFNLDPNDVFLEAVPAPSTVDVRLTSTDVQSVAFRHFDIKTTAIGLDPSGTKVGEVVTASVASWGGQLDMLIIVRPVAHPTLDDDARGEAWMRTWLQAQT